MLIFLSRSFIGESNDIVDVNVSNEMNENRIGGGLCEIGQINENERPNVANVDEVGACDNDMSIEGTIQLYMSI